MGIRHAASRVAVGVVFFCAMVATLGAVEKGRGAHEEVRQVVTQYANAYFFNDAEKFGYFTDDTYCNVDSRGVSSRKYLLSQLRIRERMSKENIEPEPLEMHLDVKSVRVSDNSTVAVVDAEWVGKKYDHENEKKLVWSKSVMFVLGYFSQSQKPGDERWFVVCDVTL